jgi:hypothetical protein
MNRINAIREINILAKTWLSQHLLNGVIYWLVASKMNLTLIQIMTINLKDLNKRNK